MEKENAPKQAKVKRAKVATAGKTEAAKAKPSAAGKREAVAWKGKLFAVVRVRGPVNVNKHVEATLEMLRLYRINHCVVVPASPSYAGMLRKAQECITWGDIDGPTLERLVFKRGRVGGQKVEAGKAAELAKKAMADGVVAGLDPVFRLNPPSKGYKAIRRFYPKGALGYRGEKINELLKRMV